MALLSGSPSPGSFRHLSTKARQPFSAASPPKVGDLQLLPHPAEVVGRHAGGPGVVGRLVLQVLQPLGHLPPPRLAARRLPRALPVQHLHRLAQHPAVVPVHHLAHHRLGLLRRQRRLPRAGGATLGPPLGPPPPGRPPPGPTARPAAARASASRSAAPSPARPAPRAASRGPARPARPSSPPGPRPRPPGARTRARGRPPRRASPA